jgi:hypothetical protein
MTMKCIPKLLPMVTALAMSTHLFAATPSGGPQTLTSPDQVPDGLAKSDWTSIRAAYEAGRHAFQPAADGWQARNPGQQWLTNFDGRGFVAFQIYFCSPRIPGVPSAPRLEPQPTC